MSSELGSWLRRQREGRGWSKREMARQLLRAGKGSGDTQLPGLDGMWHNIRRWENGGGGLSERYKLHYCKALGLSPGQFGPGLARDATGGAANSATVTFSASASPTACDARPGQDLPAVPREPGRYQEDGSHLAGLLDVVHAAERVDAEAVEGLTYLMLGYRRVYRSAAAASLLAPVCGTLTLLSELAPGAGRYRDKVVSLIGQAASLAGTIFMLDLGDFAAARRYLATGAQAAQQSGDIELMAITLSCRAFHSTYSGDPGTGLAFATGALDLAKRGIHPRTHGWVAAVASEMHATLGPHEERACMRALETAGKKIAEPMPPQPWEGIGSFDRSKLTAYRGGDLMRLGRYAEAQAELRSALDQLDTALIKHRCTAHIDLAEAYARDNKPDRSAVHAAQALEIITSTRHASSLRRVEAIYAAVKLKGGAEARNLGSRLLEFKAAS
jgi:hypothetical protein